MERRGTFDYILLETTGVADPGNIAPLFWVDDGLGSTIYLDGVVTLVDAKHILRCLDEAATESLPSSDVQPPPTTAHLQISHADVIIVNKSDLVSAAELSAVIARVRAINGLARLHVTRRAVVPELEGALLNLHAYDNTGELPDIAIGAKGHSHLDPVSPRRRGNTVHEGQEC